MSSDEDDVVAETVTPEIEEEATDLSNSDVCTKYQEASKIVNLCLEGLIEQCIEGAKIVDLCQFGTTIMEAQTSKLYTKKSKSGGGTKIDRGVAFPVCISVNDVVCNHSPLASEDLKPLKTGDVVKMDLGCHLDGYIAVAAHTVVVGGEDAYAELPDHSTLGNVAVACYNAMLVASSTIVAGNTNADVTKAVERVAQAYGVNPISSVRMHQMKRFVLDGVKEVALRDPTPDELEKDPAAAAEERVLPCTFEQGEVYAVDVCMSSGQGKCRPGELRTTVFKRNVETNYKLKMKASRAVLSQVDKQFPTLPFTLRSFDDERQAKMGITESVAHGLLTPYPSLHEYDGQVAHFKCTVLLLPSGTQKVTGLPLPSYFTTETKPDDETQAVLEAIKEKEAKKAKKKAAKKKKKNAAKTETTE